MSSKEMISKIKSFSLWTERRDRVTCDITTWHSLAVTSQVRIFDSSTYTSARLSLVLLNNIRTITP